MANKPQERKGSKSVPFSLGAGRSIETLVPLQLTTGRYRKGQTQEYEQKERCQDSEGIHSAGILLEMHETD